MLSAMGVPPSGPQEEVARRLTDLGMVLGQLPYEPLIEAVAEWFWDDRERMVDLVMTGQGRAECAETYLRLLDRALELGVSEWEGLLMRVKMLHRRFKVLPPEECLEECASLLEELKRQVEDPQQLLELEGDVLLVEGRCWISLEDYAAAVEALEATVALDRGCGAVAVGLRLCAGGIRRAGCGVGDVGDRGGGVAVRGADGVDGVVGLVVCRAVGGVGLGGRPGGVDPLVRRGGATEPGCAGVAGAAGVAAVGGGPAGPRAWRRGGRRRSI